jgi:DNA-binding CsgD family transcriptional regulator
VGTVWGGRVQWWAAVGCYDFGAWDEALVHLDSLPPPLSHAKLLGRHGLAALIAAHREEWERMREHARAGSAVPVTTVDVRAFSGYLTAARAIRAEADGNPAEAVRLLAQWLDPDPGGLDARERFLWLPDLVRLALSVGDTATAHAAAEAASKDAADPKAIPRRRAAAELCQGQLHDDIPTLRSAAETYHRHCWTMGHAMALEELAVRLAAGQDIRAARTALTGAVRIFADLDATWDLRRADARLRRHGIRRGRGGHRAHPARGWQALTPTELKIARLVADGRSNPDIAAELFLSRNTVQTHVSHILAKLGARSRAEIIRQALEQRAPADRPDGPGPAAPDRR